MKEEALSPAQPREKNGLHRENDQEGKMPQRGFKKMDKKKEKKGKGRKAASALLKKGPRFSSERRIRSVPASRRRTKEAAVRKRGEGSFLEHGLMKKKRGIYGF